MQVLKQSADGLQVADYILAHSSGVKASGSWMTLG